MKILRCWRQGILTVCMKVWSPTISLISSCVPCCTDLWWPLSTWWPGCPPMTMITTCANIVNSTFITLTPCWKHWQIQTKPRRSVSFFVSLNYTFIFQTLTQKEIQKEIIAKARRGENIVVNDKIIACYVCIVIVIILVLIVVIIVLSMFDSQKYRIFWPLKIGICIAGIACLQINWSIGLSWVNSACSNLLWLQRDLTWHLCISMKLHILHFWLQRIIALSNWQTSTILSIFFLLIFVQLWKHFWQNCWNIWNVCDIWKYCKLDGAYNIHI